MKELTLLLLNDYLQWSGKIIRRPSEINIILLSIIIGSIFLPKSRHFMNLLLCNLFYQLRPLLRIARQKFFVQ